jgi:hypothetical protein
MIHPGTADGSTVRGTFVIDPEPDEVLPAPLILDAVGDQEPQAHTLDCYFQLRKQRGQS